jgi:hypothetical protein
VTNDYLLLIVHLVRLNIIETIYCTEYGLQKTFLLSYILVNTCINATVLQVTDWDP